jgi:DtxR family Mn-dependent transcriptional regulator
MRENLTHVIEDYLKTIYDLSTTSGRATTNQIAERLGVTPASVTNMLQKLAATKPPLVEYLKHHGVLLTTDGEKVALEIVQPPPLDRDVHTRRWASAGRSPRGS